MDLIGLVARDPVIGRIAERALRARRAAVLGAAGSSPSFFAAALARIASRPVALIFAHGDEADEAFDELCSAGVTAAHLPALETLPGESSVSLDALAERLSTVRTLAQWDAEPAPPERPRVFVSTISALMQGVPALASIESVLRTVRVGETVQGGPAGLVRWLDTAGYTRVESVEEPGQFATRGGILDVFPPGDPASSGAEASADASLGGVPVRLDFFGDEVERIVEVDLQTMAADRTVKSVQLVCANPHAVQSDTGMVNPATLVPRSCLVVLNEVLELTEQGRGYFERLINSAGISGPPAVFKALQERSSGVIELTAIGQYASGEDHMLSLPVSPVPPLDHEVSVAITELGALAAGTAEGAARLRPVVLCQNEGELQRLRELIAEFAPAAKDLIESRVQYLHTGFVWGETGNATLVLPYSELLHRFTARRRRGRARLRAGRAMDTFLELEVGDYVVHQDYGIARFTGLVMLRPRDLHRSVDERMKGLPTTKEDDHPQEYLTLEFADNAKLHVPAVKVDLVQKYVGGGGPPKPGAGARGRPKSGPALSKLGGDRWKAQKARVAESVRDLAAELLRVRAARESMPGHAFPPDTPWQKAFEEEFPYDETEDQLAALQEIKRDMTRPRPMDRLLCGDVGFGKTELAVRAAFKAAEDGRQVAVLVPTTVLAEQHEGTFKSRFADYPFRVESVSRFKTDQEVREVLERLARGEVDVIIGTHRLLSKDVVFKDLGLVVVDEEQRFGVEHKERLLALRMTADVLTLSATPIPRTLHMGMMGLRDISSLATPPVDRRAVVTEVIPHNPARLKQIIERELQRDGQVFYVHNRVHDIHSVADDVQKLAPTARVVVGHGQMPPHELEEVMLKFMSRPPGADILVSTTIIESGIDIPTANTMIIEDADRFGLADLHQLRGRVGRSKHRGYCYLLLPDNRPLKEKAKQRLKALEQFSMLGAGFKIAMRDLEIRGAGNILGPEQSGHIAAVGYDMYCQLLERAVKGLKNEVVAVPSETAVEIGVSGSIPKPYIPSDMRRLEAYRRIALAGNAEELEKVRADLVAAYGDLPEQTGRLLQLAQLRTGARAAGVRLIFIRDPDVIFRTSDPAATAARLSGAPGKVTVLPPTSQGQLAEVYFRPDSPAMLQGPSLLTILNRRFAPAAAMLPAAPSREGPAGSAAVGGLAPAPRSPTTKKPSLKPPPLSKGLKDIKRSLRGGNLPPKQ
ncbi:MAG TPA: transcription-repair coupling factor [Phycisphaerales bacterium]|nr:transcription-repair coupling factor [Phycisphaerales bacterium]